MNQLYRGCTTAKSSAANQGVALDQYSPWLSMYAFIIKQ